jgi:hypothetical protein
MKILPTISVLTTLFTIFACGSGESTPEVNVYDGPVDHALLKKAFDATTKPGQYAKWAEAYPIMLETVGKETATDGNKYYWAYMEGDKCIQAEVKHDGENFSGLKVTGPINKKNKDQFEACTSKTKK